MSARAPTRSSRAAARCALVPTFTTRAPTPDPAPIFPHPLKKPRETRRHDTTQSRPTSPHLPVHRRSSRRRLRAAPRRDDAAREPSRAPRSPRPPPPSPSPNPREPPPRHPRSNPCRSCTTRSTPTKSSSRRPSPGGSFDDARAAAEEEDGGGSEDDGDVNGERWNPDDGGGFNGGDDANNGGGDWNGWRGGGDSGSGSGGSGSGGGSNSNDSFEDEFYRRVHMRGIDDHNLLWLWQALCVVTLAGSVRHVLERGDRARVESAARLLNPAESCAAAAHSMELAMEHVPTVRLADGRRGSGVGTRGGRMALTASITQSHLNLPKTLSFATAASECAAGWH